MPDNQIQVPNYLDAFTKTVEAKQNIQLRNAELQNYQNQQIA